MFQESWSKDQKLNALKEVPSILEMTSHVFFLPSYFTGPQHSMKRFRNFIQRNIDDGDMTGSKRFATKRFLLGWVYFAIHIIFSSIVSPKLCIFKLSKRRSGILPRELCYSRVS